MNRQSFYAMLVHESHSHGIGYARNSAQRLLDFFRCDLVATDIQNVRSSTDDEEQAIFAKAHIAWKEPAVPEVTFTARAARVVYAEITCHSSSSLEPELADASLRQTRITVESRRLDIRKQPADAMLPPEKRAGAA